MSSKRNAPWSRGACAECGTDILLARAEPTHGPQTCEACQVYASANADWEERVREVVAELRAEVADLARHNRNEYIRDRSEALTHAADLVAEKLGVK